MSLEKFIPATYIFYKLKKAEGFLKMSPKAEQIFSINKCILTSISNSTRLAWMFFEGPDYNNA